MVEQTGLRRRPALFGHPLDDDDEYRLANGDFEFITGLEVPRWFDMFTVAPDLVTNDRGACPL